MIPDPAVDESTEPSMGSLLPRWLARCAGALVLWVGTAVLLGIAWATAGGLELLENTSAAEGMILGLFVGAAFGFFIALFYLMLGGSLFRWMKGIVGFVVELIP